MKFIKKIFQKKPKIILLENKYRIVEAFELRGEKYMQFEDPFNAPTGRMMAAMTIYQELEMRCDKEYLLKHCRAVEVILSDRSKIDLSAIVLLNNNLKERVNLVPFPDYIYKLASVVFFLETESPYSYDFQFNQEKIKKWKAAGGVLDFLLQTPLKGLIPFSELLNNNAQTYFNTAEAVNQLHHQEIHQALSKVQ